MFAGPGFEAAGQWPKFPAPAPARSVYSGSANRRSESGARAHAKKRLDSWSDSPDPSYSKPLARTNGEEIMPDDTRHSGKRRWRPRITTDGMDRVPHRGFMRAMRLDDEALARPMFLVATADSEITPRRR